MRDKAADEEARGGDASIMQIRHGVEIATVLPDRVRLRFTDQLATLFELDRDIEFVGKIPENAYIDLRRLAESF